MARRHVSNLVGHHARQLGLFVRSQNQARVYVKEASGQSEGMDVIRVDNLNRERYLGVGVARQVLPDTIHIFVDHGVLNQLGTGFHLLGILLAHSNFAFDGIPVAQTPPAHLAVAYGVHVVLAAIVLDFAVIGLRYRLGLGLSRIGRCVLVLRILLLRILRQRRRHPVAG